MVTFGVQTLNFVYYSNFNSHFGVIFGIFELTVDFYELFCETLHKYALTAVRGLMLRSNFNNVTNCSKAARQVLL